MMLSCQQPIHEAFVEIFIKYGIENQDTLNVYNVSVFYQAIGLK